MIVEIINPKTGDAYGVTHERGSTQVGAVAITPGAEFGIRIDNSGAADKAPVWVIVSINGRNLHDGERAKLDPSTPTTIVLAGAKYTHQRGGFPFNDGAVFTAGPVPTRHPGTAHYLGGPGYVSIAAYTPGTVNPRMGLRRSPGGTTKLTLQTLLHFGLGGLPRPHEPIASASCTERIEHIQTAASDLASTR